MNRNQFCWIWGVGAWGTTTAVIFAVVMSSSTEMGFLPWLGLSLVGFPPAGYWWGRAVWHGLRRKGLADSADRDRR